MYTGFKVKIQLNLSISNSGLLLKSNFYFLKLFFLPFEPSLIGFFFKKKNHSLTRTMDNSNMHYLKPFLMFPYANLFEYNSNFLLQEANQSVK